MEQDPNNSSLLLQDALDRASRIRREISQLKAHALAQGEVCGTPPGDGSVHTPPGRQAVALMDGQLQEVSLGLASATPTALQQFEGTLREPSGQASMVALHLMPHTVSGEEQVPPLSADAELPWKIMAVFPHAGSVGRAAGAAGTGHAAQRATARSSTAPSRQAAASTSRSAAGRTLSPSKRVGGQQRGRSTLAQPADPGSVTGSIDFTALAAALQKEQQQGTGARRLAQAAASAARLPQPHRQPPSSLRKGHAAVPPAAGASRAFGASTTAGSSRQPLPQRAPTAAAAAAAPRPQTGAVRSQAGAVRLPVRKVAQGSASTAARPSQQRWEEQESAHRRLLDNLQKANAIKQASDARMRASAAPAPSVGKAGVTKQPVPPQHLRGSIGVRVQQQQPQRQQQQQQQSLREPKERVQPSVPRLEMSRIPPAPKLSSSPHGDEQPPTPQSATRQSRFSLAWLVQGEGAGREGPSTAAGAATSAAGFMSDRSPVRVPPATSAWAPHTARESPLRPQLQSRIPRPPVLRLEPPAVLRPTPVKVPTKLPDSPEEVSLRQRYRRSSSNCATSALSCSGSSSSGGSGSVRQSDAGGNLLAGWAGQQVAGPYGSPLLAAATAAGVASSAAGAASQLAVPSQPTSPPIASLPPAWQQHQQPGSAERTPRPQEGSQPHSERRRGSSFMRLLGKLSPFTKLQSPPATPADALYQPALTRLGAKVEQGMRSSLDFPDLRQSTAPPFTPTAVTSAATAEATAAAAATFEPAAVEPEEPQPASQPADLAAGATIARDAPGAGLEAGCTEAGAHCAAQQPAQPPLEEEDSQGEAQVGMKRAPPSDMEQPNSSHKKRSPLPSRAAVLAHEQEQEQQQPGQEAGVGPRAGPSSAAPRGGQKGAARAGAPSAAVGARGTSQHRPGRTPPPPKPWGQSPTKKGNGASPAPAATRRSPTKQPATRLARPGRPAAAAAQAAPANTAAASATSQAEDQPTQARERQPEGPSASSASPKKAAPGAGSPQLSPRSADGSIAAWKPPSAASQPHPISGLRQQSGSKLGYAQQAALRQGSYPGHRTNFISASDAPPPPTWGPPPPLPPPCPSSQDPSSPLPSPRSQQRPVGGSAGEGDPLQQLQEQEQGAAFRQPAWHADGGPSPGLPLPGRKSEGVEVTVLVGGIHAVHRQKQMERACNLGNLGGQQQTPSAAAEAATAGSLSRRPTTESSPGVSYSPAAPAHSRQPSSVWPPVQGLPLRQDSLGRQLLEERPEYGELPAGRMLEMLGDGRVVHKSWVRPDFKRAGSLRIMRCVLGNSGRPVLEYPHGRGWRTLFGLVKKPLLTTIRRVIVPAAEWRPGHYIVVDTDRGMLRMEPTSKAQYTLWVLGLNAALHLAARAGGGRQGQGTVAGSSSPVAASRHPTEGDASSPPDGDDSLQLVADMLWHNNVMVG